MVLLPDKLHALRDSRRVARHRAEGLSPHNSATVFLHLSTGLSPWRYARYAREEAAVAGGTPGGGVGLGSHRDGPGRRCVLGRVYLGRVDFQHGYAGAPD